MADFTVAAPPQVRGERSGRARWLPGLGVLLGVGALAALGSTGAMSTQGVGFAAVPALMLISALTSMGLSGARDGELNRNRDDYLGYLDRIAAELDEAAARQRERLGRLFPGPTALNALVCNESPWQLDRAHGAFGQVRIGLGAVPAEPMPVCDRQPDPVQPRDPVTEDALHAFLRVHAELPNMPVTVDLLNARRVAVSGEPEAVRAALRAMVCGLAATHSPAGVLIAVAAGESSWQHWDWLKWLPHNRHPIMRDERGPVPLFFAAASDALRVPVHGQQLMVIIDGVPDDSALIDRSTAILIASAAEGADLELTITAESVRASCATRTWTAVPDRMTIAEARACARRLAGFPVNPVAATPADWLAQMGIASDSDIDPVRLWHANRELRVPLGLSDGGAVVQLDIKESARQGMGPHGLCIGATGSGKSELLRTIALGMIAGHPPEELNLVLVDFKGGATFLGLDRANHVAAVITNLADEAHLVDRMQDALTGELGRRQQVLRAAGNLAGIADYRRARDGGADLAPLPTLLVIVDEFSELLSHHPEFADVFAAIGRLGRSLGVHLLLASQRLDEGRLRGLESHLSYRLCLRTLSVGESRAVLGVPDAYELPATPGAAFLKVGADAPIRFQSSYVSGPAPQLLRAPTRAEVVEFNTAPPTGTEPVPDPAQVPAVLDAVLTGLAGSGTPAHRVWLPPLATSPTLDAVLETHRGAELRVPIGLVDQVVQQRRVPLLLDLAGPGGNVAVVGGPQSGKTATLRTLALALAARHAPGAIQLYCLDFGGGGLSPLKELPHVGCVASRRDTDLMKRTVSELSALVRRRSALFAHHAVESMAEYRRRRAVGEFVGEDPFGDVFLVVDGWSVLRQEQDGLESAITNLAVEGLSLGVHVVLATSRWADLRPACKDQLGTRIELRLADPLDSEIDRRAARNVPIGRPGQGLAADGAPLTIALPQLDGPSADRLRAGYPGQRAPEIKVLPARIDLDAVLADQPDEVPAGVGRLVLGIDEIGLQPVVLDFESQPHLLIIGEHGSGKTTVLRTLMRQLHGVARQVLIDPRRAGSRLDDVLDRLRTAAPMPTFLLIDDYETLCASNAAGPAQLAELLSRARELSLHLVVARRSAGAARALYDPLLVGIRDADAFGLQLSANPDEGPLLARGLPRILPPGRGMLLSRTGGEQLVQVAWCQP